MRTLLLLFSLAACDTPLEFVSEESKTGKGGQVINRITWSTQGKRDIWMMHQRGAGVHKWDRLAIVVDRAASPPTARFFQFEEGPLKWQENLPTKEYRVSCFLCHANGPRAIRPEPGTQRPLARARTWLWNLRIKSYGRVVPHPSHQTEDRALPRPFRVAHPMENEPLLIEGCTRCHREEGWFARGTLVRQNSLTIKHLVSAGRMPPWPFALTETEKTKLDAYLEGF